MSKRDTLVKIGAVMAAAGFVLIKAGQSIIRKASR